MKKLKLSRAQVRVSHFAGSNDTLEEILEVKESGDTYNILMPVMKYCIGILSFIGSLFSINNKGPCLRVIQALSAKIKRK